MTAAGSPALLVRVQQLMREGALADADAMLEAALAAAPRDANLLYLRSVIANRRGDHRAAIAFVRESIAVQPDAPAWLALGNAYTRTEQGAAAIAAYREALARKPDWPDAQFNLGLALKRQGELADAARAFHAAWVLDPSVPEAADECVATIAAWVRVESAAPTLAPIALEPAPPTVSIVVCSIDDAKAQRVEALYRQVFSAVTHELALIRNAPSLAEAYNRAIAAATGDLVILSHDDIDILAPDFAARLLRHLRTFDAIGVAGAVRVTGPAPNWSGRPYLRGWITHRTPGDPAWRADVLDPRPVAGAIAVLDGVLLAARREVFAAVPFDALTFDGFHLYDVDWSYRASQAGFRLGVTGDLLVVHQSRGKYDERWRRYAERFNAKHALALMPPPAAGVFYQAVLDNPEEVRAFYARLAELSA